MKKSKIDVSVIVPVHNEEELIKHFLKDVDNACSNLNLLYEIVVVENGSKDKTWQYLQEIAKENQKIRPIQLKILGYGPALIMGINKSLGEYGVIFNVDFWDDKFLMLTKANILGQDLIIGSKCLPGSLDLRSFRRRAITKAFNVFLKIFLGFKGTDTHGIKLLRLPVILPILKLCRTQSGIFDSELVIRSQRKGLKILELPVTVKDIRPERFGYNRLLKTPFDVYNLYRSLKEVDS